MMLSSKILNLWTGMRRSVSGEVFCESLHFIDCAYLIPDIYFDNRGRKGIQMYPNYEKSVKSLAAFTEVAARSVTIPMASPDE